MLDKESFGWSDLLTRLDAAAPGQHALFALSAAIAEPFLTTFGMMFVGLLSKEFLESIDKLELHSIVEPLKYVSFERKADLVEYRDVNLRGLMLTRQRSRGLNCDLAKRFDYLANLADGVRPPVESNNDIVEIVDIRGHESSFAIIGFFAEIELLNPLIMSVTFRCESSRKSDMARHFESQLRSAAVMLRTDLHAARRVDVGLLSLGYWSSARRRIWDSLDPSIDDEAPSVQEVLTDQQASVPPLSSVHIRVAAQVAVSRYIAKLGPINWDTYQGLIKAKPQDLKLEDIPALSEKYHLVRHHDNASWLLVHVSNPTKEDMPLDSVVEVLPDTKIFRAAERQFMDAEQKSFVVSVDIHVSALIAIARGISPGDCVVEHSLDFNGRLARCVVKPPQRSLDVASSP